MKREDLKECVLNELHDLEIRIELIKSRLRSEVSTKTISLETGRLNRLLGQLEAKDTGEIKP